MSKERQPLLTEEQIQEMLAEAGSDNQLYWLSARFPDVFNEVIRRNPSREIRLAFLRGKTKRVLNLDRLRADVKAWVDDPNRKYPEWWIVFKDDEVIEAVSDYDKTIDDTPNLCCYANVIGINPDDYFEEVEDGAHQEQLKIEDNNDKR